MSREPRPVVVRTRMTVAEVESLDALAAKWDCSRSDVVRRLVLRGGPPPEGGAVPASPVHVAAQGAAVREVRPLSKTDQARGRNAVREARPVPKPGAR